MGHFLRKLSNATLENGSGFGAGLIVLTLAICWMPNQVRRIMAAARPKENWTRSYFRAYMTLLPFSDTFFYLSSVINPLLYNVSSRQFRAVFWQVFLSTFQSQADAQPEAEAQPSSPESPEPQWETKPASSAAENGVQEHEV
ncbi:G-protein coupled receptor 39 [Myotis davidii]|uniref:G-protein coupled receptor 39 n=1 Tax=Myotis davidii TaxID=225400 RepID=L5M0K8_MYODS|nr:G-protein coupled receptor 39 [Myotis davidii]